MANEVRGGRLTLTRLTKRYLGTTAVDAIDLEVAVAWFLGERRLSPGSEGTVTGAKGGSSGAGVEDRDRRQRMDDRDGHHALAPVHGGGADEGSHQRVKTPPEHTGRSLPPLFV
jgi:hypothetical protein